MNEELISKFCDYLVSNRISPNRVKKYLYTMNTIDKRINKPFKDCTREDIEKFTAGIERSDYKENTKRDFMVIIKRFWKWLKKTDRYPKEVSWINTTADRRKQKTIKTEDCLTEEEVYKMVDNAPNLRDKALISLLFESGARISEVMKLTIGDIVFDDGGYSFISSGKSGEVYARIVNFRAVDILKSWIMTHPIKDDRTAPLWVVLKRSNLGLKPLEYPGALKMIKLIGKKTKITKNFNPHWFRHARITDLRVNRGVPDAIIENMVGWIPGSNMFKIYSHTKTRDIDKAMSESYGLKDEQKRKKMSEELDRLLIEEPAIRDIIVRRLMKRGVKV